MDTPPFLGIVVNGNGRITATFTGDTLGAAQGPTMREWQDQQQKWEASGKTKKGIANRCAEPPCWDVYRRWERPSPNPEALPENQG
jgi:hypothetical protein